MVGSQFSESDNLERHQYLADGNNSFEETLGFASDPAGA